MVKGYSRFCCGLYHLLRKAGSDIPAYATFVATMFLMQLILFATESLLRLVWHVRPISDPGYLFLGAILFGALTYFPIFWKGNFLKYYKVKMNNFYVIFIVVIIFSTCIGIIISAGPANKKHSKIAFPGVIVVKPAAIMSVTL